MNENAKTRLFTESPLAEGLAIDVPREQAHYLANVLRLEAGAHVALFNGHDGEWLCVIEAANKRGASLRALRQTAPQTPVPDLWLIFAPVKKNRTDFIVEKACELGCARIAPVFTRFTNSERVNADRLRATAIEAAEQCGGVYVPDVAEPQKLGQVLANWEPARRLLFCDETREAPAAAEALRAQGPGPWAILIGPEGGFSPEERTLLRALPYAVPASLGPRILRAETAAAAAIAVFQTVLGDWR